jgi:hypothetical protein
MEILGIEIPLDVLLTIVSASGLVGFVLGIGARYLIDRIQTEEVNTDETGQVSEKKSNPARSSTLPIPAGNSKSLNWMRKPMSWSETSSFISSPV